MERIGLHPRRGPTSTEPMTPKSFTVQEANALLPEVESVLEELQELRSRLADRHEKLQVLDALWGRKVFEPSNPDHEEFLELRTAIRDGIEVMETMIREELVDRGIRFPSGGLEHGLVDFPTTWKGRWVYLCWHPGESEIQAWHEVDGGFAGRRPLTDEQARRMGREDDPEELDDSALDF